MAFLPDDEMAAFEAAMSFVDEFTSLNGTAPVAAQPSEVLNTQEMEWALSLPTKDSSSASPPLTGASVSSPASNSEHHHTTTDEDGSPRRTEREKPKRTRAPRRQTTKKLLRKSWATGDSNRARNERRIEVAYLKEKVAQLESELEALQQHRASTKLIKQDGHEDSTAQDGAMVPSSMTEQSVWKPVAQQQRKRREKAEIENARLKLVLESQLKAAKSMQMLLLKRAKNQLMECARTVTSDTTDFAAGRMVNYHSNLGDFEDMLVILEGAYREMDAVFCTNGLESMEVTYKDTQVREGDDGIYLDVFSNKVLPFDMDTTAAAVWDHFKGTDKHRGKVYEKTAKVLDESDTIVENFAKEMYVGSTHAMFRVKQVLRRYVEEDRVVVVFISIKTPLEVVDEPFAGLTHRHQCYAVAKRSTVPPSQSVGPRCLLQMCSLVSLEHGQEQPEKDSPVMSAMTKFMMGAAANSITASQELIENNKNRKTPHITASQELIENALMDKAVIQPVGINQNWSNLVHFVSKPQENSLRFKMWVDKNVLSSMQQTARLQQMQWAEGLLVCLVALFLCGSYLFCFLYRRCWLSKRRYCEMARVPSAAITVSDMEEPLLGDSNYENQLPIIDSVPLAHEYQPSAPPLLSWENEHRGFS
ncbi:M96 mating-specific protein [Phytophthora megakarya]|uniref:M96 mating-specific protein n=1 Tax=Phytophthora megakarya TaxID=4795 RepID=A0A225X4D9_9STRA|nr:M96 mating-specific protein [Phytophthora megakarya]